MSDQQKLEPGVRVANIVQRAWSVAFGHIDSISEESIIVSYDGKDGTRTWIGTPVEFAECWRTIIPQWDRWSDHSYYGRFLGWATAPFVAPGGGWLRYAIHREGPGPGLRWVIVSWPDSGGLGPQDVACSKGCYYDYMDQSGTARARCAEEAVMSAKQRYGVDVDAEAQARRWHGDDEREEIGR